MSKEAQRSAESRAKPDKLLGGRKAKLSAEDIGTPSFAQDIQDALNSNKGVEHGSA